METGPLHRPTLQALPCSLHPSTPLTRRTLTKASNWDSRGAPCSGRGRRWYLPGEGGVASQAGHIPRASPTPAFHPATPAAGEAEATAGGQTQISVPSTPGPSAGLALGTCRRAAGIRAACTPPRSRAHHPHPGWPRRGAPPAGPRRCGTRGTCSRSAGQSRESARRSGGRRAMTDVQATQRELPARVLSVTCESHGQLSMPWGQGKGSSQRAAGVS